MPALEDNLAREEFKDLDDACDDFDDACDDFDNANHRINSVETIDYVSSPDVGWDSRDMRELDKDKYGELIKGAPVEDYGEDKYLEELW